MRPSSAYTKRVESHWWRRCWLKAQMKHEQLGVTCNIGHLDTRIVARGQRAKWAHGICAYVGCKYRTLVIVPGTVAFAFEGMQDDTNHQVLLKFGGTFARCFFHHKLCEWRVQRSQVCLDTSRKRARKCGVCQDSYRTSSAFSAKSSGASLIAYKGCSG